jgi:hypothetical protein
MTDAAADRLLLALLALLCLLVRMPSDAHSAHNAGKSAAKRLACVAKVA